MSVVFGCLMPHPPIIIPEIGKDDLAGVINTVNAMEEATENILETQPDTIVFISPHSTGFRDAIAVKTEPVLKGDFGIFRAPSVGFSVKNDLAFVDMLFSVAKKYDLPMATVNSPDNILLDHGIMVPLYFIKKKFDELGRSFNIVSLAIDYLGYSEHFTLGQAVAKTAEATGKTIAFVASGDLSHRLTPGAPNGYNPRGSEFEALIEEIFKTGDFKKLEFLDKKLIEDAGECGLRSIYTLAGVFSGTKFETKVLSHEGPFGVGYMVATVIPHEDIVSFSRQNTSLQSESSQGHRMTFKMPGAPVELARHSLETFFKLGSLPDVPENIPDELRERKAGAFVCLKKSGDLRGCIGTIQPAYNNIAEEIMANAVQAATSDPRFYPVDAHELPDLTFSVDILSEPELIKSKDMLDPLNYGVIVRSGYKTGLLLPNLEGVDTIDDQLSIAKKKAGIGPFEDVELYRFRVIRYE